MGTVIRYLCDCGKREALFRGEIDVPPDKSGSLTWIGGPICWDASLAVAVLDVDVSDVHGDDGHGVGTFRLSSCCRNSWNGVGTGTGGRQSITLLELLLQSSKLTLGGGDGGLRGPRRAPGAGRLSIIGGGGLRRRIGGISGERRRISRGGDRGERGRRWGGMSEVERGGGARSRSRARLLLSGLESFSSNIFLYPLCRQRVGSFSSTSSSFLSQ